MSNDDTLRTALWLALGGAAGYAVARRVVEPRLATASSTPARSVSTPKLSTRALAAPSGVAMPIDPYAAGADSTTRVAGPSGDMRPVDPYADFAPGVANAPVVLVAQPPTTIKLTSVGTAVAASIPKVTDGPITMPSQLTISAPSSTSGPITRPPQAETRPVVAPSSQFSLMPSASTLRPPFATSDRVRQFDPAFDRYRGTLPIEYVRALVERESNGQPSVRAGSAIGLMQIVPVVLTDYNKRHGTAYWSEHLADPAINVAIGCELLRLIVESYRKNHPRITTLQADWNNLRFVELLTLGWNAGFSEAGGVGRVARHLEALGAVELTVEQVSAHAKLAGASKYLSNPAKVVWCKSVVALYQRERAFDRAAQTFATS